MQTSDYWEQRALQREAEAFQDTADAIRRLRILYDRAGKRLSDAAKNIFANYLTASGIDADKARTLLSAQESAALLNQLRQEYLKTGDTEALAKLNAPAYAYRISRVQAMRQVIEAETASLAEQERRIGEMQLVRAYDDGYYKTMYDAAAGQENGVSLKPLLQRTVAEAVESKWKGRNYSQRVWGNTEVVAAEAGKIIDSGVTAGSGVYKMAYELKDLLNAGAYASERLIRTETNRMHNDAARTAYGAMGVKEYRYLATLDARTCAVCGALDGKHFKLANAKTGVNFPPMHPNDRCTTVAYDPDEKLDGVRTARNPKTGKNYKVPEGMTYTEWRAEVDRKYGAGALEKAQQMTANRKSDAAQYAEYKKALGKDAPKAFADFQNLKYNEPEKWRYTRLDYSRRKELIGHPELKLPNAEVVKVEDTKFTGYLFNPDNPKGYAKGLAFTSRLGYSIDNWPDLQNAILRNAPKYPAMFKLTDQYGDKYEQKIILYGLKEKPANVVVAWQAQGGKTRMTSCYIKEVGKDA